MFTYVENSTMLQFLTAVIAGNGDDASRERESDHSDSRSNASCDSEKSNDEENLDAEQKCDGSTGPDNREISTHESDNEIEGIIRENNEEPEDSRDKDESASSRRNTKYGDEDDTDDSEHSGE